MADRLLTPHEVEPELTPTDRVAPDIIVSARQLLDLLESYRNAIVFEHRLDYDVPDDPIPW